MSTANTNYRLNYPKSRSLTNKIRGWVWVVACCCVFAISPYARAVKDGSCSAGQRYRSGNKHRNQVIIASSSGLYYHDPIVNHPTYVNHLPERVSHFTLTRPGGLAILIGSGMAGLQQIHPGVKKQLENHQLAFHWVSKSPGPTHKRPLGPGELKLPIKFHQMQFEDLPITHQDIGVKLADRQMNFKEGSWRPNRDWQSILTSQAAWANGVIWFANHGHDQSHLLAAYKSYHAAQTEQYGPFNPDHEHDAFALAQAYIEKIKPIVRTTHGTEKNRPVIWTHDFQIRSIPELSRKEFGPETPIVTSIHTPIADIDQLSRVNLAYVAWTKSLLSSDRITVHTPKDQEHLLEFVDHNAVVLGSHLDDKISVSHDGITVGSRFVEVKPVPAGLPINEINGWVHDQAVHRGALKLMERFKGKKIISAMARLDTTKGWEPLVDAVGIAATKDPKIASEHVVYLRVSPSREDVPAVQQYLARLKNKIEVINSQHGTHEAPFIVLDYKGWNRPECGMINMASSFVVHPSLFDGFNIILGETGTVAGKIARNADLAKTFPAAVTIAGDGSGLTQYLDRLRADGPLLVSVGAANGTEQLAHALLKAMKMSDRERRDHVIGFAEQLDPMTSEAWVNGSIGDYLPH